MAWFVVLGLDTTMGVAWHRFTVWPNIWFKREASGAPALGALPPVRAGGEPVDFDDLDALDEDASLGTGRIEDFSWKGLLDLTSCTECGRCQDACPAWATDKPLSPKLVVMGLRDHAYAKAPWLQTPEGERDGLPEALRREAARPLVGPTGYAEPDPITIRRGPVGVIDPDALWSCTTCGACVQACPVDIEHVDHIVDLRRHQVLMESEFPSSLNGLFKGLETKGNPWNASPRTRMDWAKDLPFDVPVVGGPGEHDVEDLSGVDYLFWVGCAGAYDDRAKNTTRAVAELLHTAGVSYAVLGKGETCSGDPARRAGNELVFQQLAAQNTETLREAGATKIVATCAHCLNTLKNEYPQLGLSVEVVHHTQLLNRLVREGRLTPVPPADGRAERGRSPTTTPATSAGTTRCTSPRASCSARCPARPSPRCRGAGRTRSAAAPAARGCGWRRTSAPASTPTAPRRPSPPSPPPEPAPRRFRGRSRPAAPSAARCSATGWTRCPTARRSRRRGARRRPAAARVGPPGALTGPTSLGRYAFPLGDAASPHAP